MVTGDLYCFCNSLNCGQPGFGTICQDSFPLHSITVLCMNFKKCADTVAMTYMTFIYR